MDNTEAPRVPWIPGMRATDEKGRAWRRTTAGHWQPDDDVPTVTPTGTLTADFSDMTTGVVVQWIVSEAQKQNAAIEKRAAESAADPTHPDNIMAGLARAKEGTDGSQ